MDYGNEAAQKGTTIDVPISTAISTTTVEPSNVLPAPGDTTPDLVQISLDKWMKNTPFHLTDKELVEVDRNSHFVPMQVSEAIRGLANQVNQDIFAEYTDVGNLANPEAAALTISHIVDARKLLNKSNAPSDNRVMVINHEAEAEMLALAGFSQWQTGGSSTDSIQVQGEIGTRYGFTWYADDDCPLHTNGSGAADAGAVNSATCAIGDRTLAIDGQAVSSGTIKAGESFTIAGDSTYYSVTTDVTLSGGAATLAISPALKVAAADDEVVTWVDQTASSTGRVGLAFHRDAFALATRPLMASSSDMALGSNIMSMTDPQTGLSLRLEVQRQYKQTTWEFDILYGVKCVRPEFACKFYTSED
jgi:hypothetical protein